MPFLAPLMLIGATAAGIPLILHFLYRARYTPVPWGAMKFLRLAVEQTSRRLRFQELILLILRILLLVLLAVALARPFLSSAVTAGKRGEAVDAVFVMDLSYSMDAREGPRTRLEMAKEAAIKVIDDLPPNSTVQVITCTDRAVAAGPKSPRNLDQAKLLIQNLQVTQQSTDFLGGLSEAGAALSRAEGAAKEIYLFSDMQRGGWERQSSAIRVKCEELKAQGSLFLVRCGSQPVRNVAIVDLRPQTDIPHTGARMPFTVIVKNTGTEPVTGLTVTLKIDGQPLDKDAQPIEKLGPGETKPVTLTGKIDKAGWRVLTAEVKPDDLDDDNKFDKVILVRDKVRVLVVDGSSNDRDPEKAGSYFLAHALLPVPEEFRFQYHVQPTVVRADAAGPGLLADKEVCVLVNCPVGGPGSLPADFLQRLGEFVKDGHGLLVTSGPNVEKAVYNRVLGPGGSNLLPMELGDTFDVPKDTPIFPDPNSIDEKSFLARFKLSANDPFLQLRDAFVLKGVGVAEPKADQLKDAGRVLMRFNDGRPALLGKQAGEGEVLFLTTSVDKDWGFFSTNLTFQPFIHGALTHLIERSATAFNRIAGEPIRWTPKELAKSYQVIKPDGSKARLGKAAGGANEKLALTVADTAKAGVYTIAEENTEQGTKFAVIPDLRESETMDPLPDVQIDELLGFKAEHLSTGGEAIAKAESVRSRNEWTVTALLVLLLFAIGETAWAWFCGKAW
jgi:von Willebrand factor type A domain/Aerotolerance regulator N-terminal/CARDB